MSHCGHHHHDDASTSHRLKWALGVIATFMVIEIVGGFVSRSLALMADGVHMMTDAAALALALSAQYFARRPADARHHFGHRRGQVLAGFANGVIMAALLFWIIVEALMRFVNPVEINSSLMLWIAVIGLAANAMAFVILHRPNEDNINMRGAMLHVIGDLFGSVAAIIAAIVIAFTGWARIDPVLSILVAILIGISASRLIRETANILLEGAPENISRDEIAASITAGVRTAKDIGCLKLWQITPGDNCAIMRV